MSGQDMRKLMESINTPLNEEESGMVSRLKQKTANVMFSDCWASYVDEHDDEEHYSAGAEITEVSPEYPPEIMELVDQLYKTTAQMNGMSIEELVQKANKVAGQDASDDFAYYIYMSAVGHGVSWTDNHPESGIKVPSGEAYVYKNEDGSWGIEGYMNDTRFGGTL